MIYITWYTLIAVMFAIVWLASFVTMLIITTNKKSATSTGNRHSAMKRV